MDWKRLPESEELFRRLKERFNPNKDWRTAEGPQVDRLKGQAEVLEFLEDYLDGLS